MLKILSDNIDLICDIEVKCVESCSWLYGGKCRECEIVSRQFYQLRLNQNKGRKLFIYRSVSLIGSWSCEPGKPRVSYEIRPLEKGRNHPENICLCSGDYSRFHNIVKERISKELEKLFLCLEVLVRNSNRDIAWFITKIIDLKIFFLKPIYATEEEYYSSYVIDVNVTPGNVANYIQK
jgi:hypothetical protein